MQIFTKARMITVLVTVVVIALLNRNAMASEYLNNESSFFGF